MNDATPIDISDAHTGVIPLNGRRAVITGGTTGIGRAIAVLLASEGVEVFICGRREDHLADALERINEVGVGHGMSIDLSFADAPRKFFEAAVARFGIPDIAVINAGVPARAIGDMAAHEVEYAVKTDFLGYMLSTHAAVDLMQENGGDIVVIGSLTAHVLGGSSTVYAAIKAGQQGFVEALRREISPYGIRAMLIEPGKTGSDFQYPDLDNEKQREMIEKHTMLRAEDIAVGVHYALTQPNRAVVQQLTIVPRAQEGE